MKERIFKANSGNRIEFYSSLHNTTKIVTEVANKYVITTVLLLSNDIQLNPGPGENPGN